MKSPNLSEFNVSEPPISVSPLPPPAQEDPHQHNGYNDYSYLHGAKADKKKDTNPPHHQFVRRSSTNYADALNDKEKATATTLPHHPRHKSGSPEMNLQDLRHDHQMQNTEHTKHKCADMGDYILGKTTTPETQQVEDTDPVTGSQAATTATSTSAIPKTTPAAPTDVPQMQRRKSSFVYEDFKKDMYDRLKMFEKK